MEHMISIQLVLTLHVKPSQCFMRNFKDNDVFSLVIFHTQASTIIKSTFKKNLSPETFQSTINKQFESGGTTIKQGFRESLKNINEFRESNTLSSEYEHRIVMLTDVGDNSVANQNILIEKISNQENVNTTIIGISSEFKSETCEKLIEVKGFNYFCAVENKDLQTYLADRFDYNFFPCVQKVEISIESDQVDSIEVFGTVDSDTKYEKEGNKLTVTKMRTGFPSELQINKKGNVETQGGLILVKLKLKDEQKLPHLQIKVNLSYQDLNGKQFQEIYQIDNKLQVEEYYSDEAIQKGVGLFYYTHTMRKLLKDMTLGTNEQVLNDENKSLYKEKLEKLKELCPKEKLQELGKVIEIVEQHKTFVARKH